jgi:hypothetical protein
MPPIREAQL